MCKHLERHGKHDCQSCYRITMSIDDNRCIGTDLVSFFSDGTSTKELFSRVEAGVAGADVAGVPGADVEGVEARSFSLVLVGVWATAS